MRRLLFLLTTPKDASAKADVHCAIVASDAPAATISTRNTQNVPQSCIRDGKSRTARDARGGRGYASRQGYSLLRSNEHDPLFITKNGYGDMVLMSMRHYERTLARQEVFDKLDEAEEQVAAGRTRDAFASLRELRGKYHV